MFLDKQKNAINYIFGKNSTDDVTNVANFSGSNSSRIILSRPQREKIDEAVTKFGNNNDDLKKILKFALSNSGSLTEANIQKAVDRAENIYNKFKRTYHISVSFDGRHVVVFEDFSIDVFLGVQNKRHS